MDSITRAHPSEIGPLTNDHWIESIAGANAGPHRAVRSASAGRFPAAAGRRSTLLPDSPSPASNPVVSIPAASIPAASIPIRTGFFVGQDDWVERQYLADDLDLAADPRVSPMHADSHADLAPAIIGIGHHDPLLDQDLAYAKVLAAAGVPTILREYPDLIHGFFGMGGVSASAERAASQLCRDLRTLLTNHYRRPHRPFLVIPKEVGSIRYPSDGLNLLPRPPVAHPRTIFQALHPQGRRSPQQSANSLLMINAFGSDAPTGSVAAADLIPRAESQAQPMLPVAIGARHSTRRFCWSRPSRRDTG